MALATDALTAFTRATDGEVTYVYSQDGRLVACVAPPEAGERFEHSSAVPVSSGQHEATVPALVPTGPRHRRRRRSWLGPFEGIF
jgi:hypothetical protein